MTNKSKVMPERKLNSSANIQLRFVWRSHTHNMTEKNYLLFNFNWLKFVRYTHTRIGNEKKRKDEKKKKERNVWPTFQYVYTHVHTHNQTNEQIKNWWSEWNTNNKNEKEKKKSERKCVWRHTHSVYSLFTIGMDWIN